MVASHRLLTLMVFALLTVPMISGLISDKCTEGCKSTIGCNTRCMMRGGGYCESAKIHGAVKIFCCCNNYSNSPISSPVMN
ncbi:hypothetical protein ISN45_At05g050860 [Arabidopsis thaliana x Arabidopsis arenosa]|uniref:Defensin n=2 Tax=Arabidopsis TaxID=3701 RepID=A0A8T2DLW5_ARASU|nr:hypothetical protein ISN45_At05g050860 [Arabidopsis thaliana x Arabidopsis arenosa]KAG7613055.1 hypothetical protein ISN44_As05g050140 [Arabidopsis suecica]